MSFALGLRSKYNLIGVQPPLVEIVKLAIQITRIDFTVREGLRTESRQKKLVASGASETLKSKHLTGHAVDLAPYVDRTIRWDWPLFYPIADAMRAAALRLKTNLKWGGAWVVLNNTTQDPEELMHEYQARCKAGHYKPFCDGPHFELLVGGR